MKFKIKQISKKLRKQFIRLNGFDVINIDNIVGSALTPQERNCLRRQSKCQTFSLFPKICVSFTLTKPLQTIRSKKYILRHLSLSRNKCYKFNVPVKNNSSFLAGQQFYITAINNTYFLTAKDNREFQNITLKD